MYWPSLNGTLGRWDAGRFGEYHCLRPTVYMQNEPLFMNRVKKYGSLARRFQFFFLFLHTHAPLLRLKCLWSGGNQ